MFVRIEYLGYVGYGEACLPEYLGETTESTVAFLEKAKSLDDRALFETGISSFFEKADSLSSANNAAKAAINISLNDLFGKLNNQPFYAAAGIGKSKPIATSATIGIDRPEMIARKIEEAAEFSVLKIKAGTADDKALVNLVRRYTDKPLYIDVNQGWTKKELVLEMLHWMKEKNVVLVEQPMPVDRLDEMAWVMEQSPLPLIADESIKRLSDLEKIKGAFTGINIKLMKSAGLNEAIEMISFARKNNMQVMLGCMAESSCATSAMAQLMKLADFIDLDAPKLIKNDPFRGISYQHGNVVLNDLPGIGVELVENNFFD